MATPVHSTVQVRITETLGSLTRAERQLAHCMLQDYPMIGLSSLSELAESAGVSAPTVVRMARKLGYEGFPALQKALHEEVADRIKAPSSKQAHPRGQTLDTHFLNKFADGVAENLAQTLDHLDQSAFDKATDLLSDTDRSIFLAGGRITRSIADYLFNHLQIIRPKVVLMDRSPNVWPQYLLDMNENSVLVVYDIRRYETDLQKLARLAHERGSAIVLFTDLWGSPIAKQAEVAFHSLIEVPSSWDSNMALLLISEALIAQVQANLWDDSSKRMEALESMFDKTRIFRDFS